MEENIPKEPLPILPILRKKGGAIAIKPRRRDWGRELREKGLSAKRKYPTQNTKLGKL